MALPEITVASAGTGALVGQPPTDLVRALLSEHGVDPGDSVARSMHRAAVRGARLVVTAERRHRVEVARLVPDAADRTYTLLELARVLRDAGSPSSIGVDGVLEIARGAASDDRDHDDDLADPYGRSERHYIEMALTADRAISVLVPALRPPT